MKNIRIYAFLVSFFVFSCPFISLANSLQTFLDQQGTIRIIGGTAHISIMKSVAKNIMMANPDISISISGGGSALGIKKVANGDAEIGNSGRPLTNIEKQMYGITDWPLAIDSLAMIVNSSNIIDELTKDQVKSIYSGKVKNWKELGGADAPITVYAREEKSGTQTTFSMLALDEEVPPANLWNILKSNGSMRTAISLDKNAIGYISIGFLDRRRRIKRIALNGVLPTQETTKDSSYILTRKLYMNTKSDPDDLTKAFIDYIYSPEGASIIVKSGFIPVEKEKQ